MFVVSISWLFMFGLFWCLGAIINCCFKMQKNIHHDMAYLIWMGIIATTVYAQYFSLFYKLGIKALVILLGSVLIGIVICRKEIYKLVKDIRIINNPTKLARCCFVGFLIILLGLIITSRPAIHYDTYLYHAQNIHWMEKYSVIKGLGNLHNRFAYNSAFMSAQALLSFSWHYDQSLHTLNGFLWVFMMIYALFSLKGSKDKKIYVSDFFRILLITYLLNSEVWEKISSPHTDCMTMLLISFILIRWSEYIESENESNVEYGYLCLMGVFAVSVKLSAGLILLMTIKPAIGFIKDKKWKNILLFISGGIVIILPFILRNIILSGYLVYPYASIDLFNVDWKMPASTVTFDNHEIIAWGRGLNDINRYAEPITTWLPIWLEKESGYFAVLMILSIFLSFVSIFRIIKLVRNRKYTEALFVSCLVCLFLGWLFTAPLIRYGLIYLYVLPFYYLSQCLEKISKQNKKSIVAMYYVIPIILSTLLLWNIKSEIIGIIKEYNILPADYRYVYEVESVNWDSIEIYVPTNGDQVSYEPFPSTPYRERLKVIELIGNDISEGIRIKEQYKDKSINTYGYVME